MTFIRVCAVNGSSYELLKNTRLSGSGHLGTLYEAWNEEKTRTTTLNGIFKSICNSIIAVYIEVSVYTWIFPGGDCLFRTIISEGDICRTGYTNDSEFGDIWMIYIFCCINNLLCKAKKPPILRF